MDSFLHKLTELFIKIYSTIYLFIIIRLQLRLALVRPMFCTLELGLS